jgi:hypothetical protein
MKLNEVYNFFATNFYNFFFNYYVSPEFIGAYRIAACAILLIYLTIIIKDVLIFCKSDGIYPYHAFKKSMLGINNNFNLFLYLNFPSAHYFILFAFYLFGILSLVGLFTSLSLPIFFILFLSLQSRISPINSSGGDVISNFILFLLCFMNSGAALSLDSIFLNNDITDAVPGWPLRLIQISISFGYLWSALFKIISPDWTLGSAVTNAVFFSSWGKKNFNKVLMNKLIARTSSITVILFQFFAPVLFWIQELRPLAIIFGILLHLMMCLTLRIGYFGPIMILGILSFAANYFVK